ncbi:MAG TPA: hypothetical protein PKX18_07990 [Thermosynergistes sp.]|nr:hypothetical protein [Synergistota bacterium]HPZ76899.1 hypothetical protein [Thermosynergistes sp.]
MDRKITSPTGIAGMKDASNVFRAVRVRGAAAEIIAMKHGG